MVREKGFTVPADNLKPLQVEERSWLLNCSCGGSAWVAEYGKLLSHSDPFDMEVAHFLRPFWKNDTIWRYELVE